MRAMILNAPGGLDKLKIVDAPDPTPGPMEVLVQWHASSLNYHDYFVVAGLQKCQDKLIPMSDGAGTVLAVGDLVSQWQPGDNVMSTFFPDWVDGKPTLANTQAITGDSINGTALDKACVPATALTRIPSGYSFAEAATLPCAALTVWRALFVEGGLKAGDTVLVEGTGGVSIFALQFAKAAGAYVYATSSSDEKREKLKALGADETLNYKTEPQWGKAINSLSGGGVDHVLDVGGGATLSQSVTAAKVGGNVSLIGILDDIRAELILPAVIMRHVKLQGLAVGSHAMQQAMVNAININHIKPVIDRSFNLNELADAFRYQESGKHFGKIVVEY